MKNSAKFLIISLTAAVVVACPVTPEGGGDSSAAREYKITYTVSGSDSVTVNGPATAKSGDTVTFTIDGIEFDKRLVSVEYPTAITTKQPANTVSPCRDWIPPSLLPLKR